MWNSMGGGFDSGYGGGSEGGGFMSTQSQFASPAGQEQKKVRRSQNLVPLTLQAILKSGDENLQIADMDVHMVVVVGLIRAVDITSTKITYTIDDSTATMEAVQWIESDQDAEDPSRNPLMEMTYCRISGAVRSQKGKRHLMVFRIVPITDLNLITTHILEVMQTALKLQHIQTHSISQGANMARASGPSNMGMMSNSLVGASGLDGGAGGVGMGGGGFAGMQGLSGQQRFVYEVIHQCPDEAGVARDVIYATFKGRFNHSEINQVLDFLSSEGHIYSTIDDDHFKSTDS